jgi:hypothetical protein
MEFSVPKKLDEFDVPITTMRTQIVPPVDKIERLSDNEIAVRPTKRD